MLGDLAEIHDLGIRCLAQEFERQMHGLRAHPRDITTPEVGGLSQRLLEIHDAGLQILIDIYGYEATHIISVTVYRCNGVTVRMVLLPTVYCHIDSEVRQSLQAGQTLGHIGLGGVLQAL